MRISLIIISLFTFFGAMAQSESPYTSSNTEKHRSPIKPYATEAGAQTGEEEGLRFTMPLAGWQESKSGNTSTFTTTFVKPFSWLNRQATLVVEGASQPYTVSVNNKEIGRCTNSAMPAEFNITRELKEKESQITITMQASNHSSQIEGWRAEDDNNELGKVAIISQPALYIRDIETETSSSDGVINAEISLKVKSSTLNARTSRLLYTLRSKDGALIYDGSANVTLEMQGEQTVTIFSSIADSLAWSAESPNLLSLTAQTRYRNRAEEFINFRIGLRTIEVSPQGDFTINNKPTILKIKEVEPSISIHEIDQIKAEGYNTIRIRAGRYNAQTYSHADKIGLYIIATAPINTSKSGENIKRNGNPTNDPAREAEFIERTDALYNTLKIHPSVIAFALADESLNGYNLYESYLYLKSLEKHRPIIYTDGDEQWNSDKLKSQE